MEKLTKYELKKKKKEIMSWGKPPKPITKRFKKPNF